jgi:hypothetical protein
MNATESMAPTAAVTSAGLANVQKLTFNISYRTNGYSQIALNTIITILDNNSGLTHLELQMYGDLLESSVGPGFLDLMHSGLPHLRRLILKGHHAFPVIRAMEALEICLGHPSLTDVQFYTYIERQYRGDSFDSIDQTHFYPLLEFLNGLDKAGTQSQDAIGCQLTSLALPYISGGYPRSFLLPLLRTYLPHLERFMVPVLDGHYERELEEVIAGHCSNLQHISYTFSTKVREQNSSVIKAVIRGCSRWSGLRSIRIFGYDASLDIGLSCGLVETLVEHHSKTLESVELQGWDSEGVYLLDPIFTGCQNLKSFKVLPIDEGWATYMCFVQISMDPWVFRGLKELHLHFAQKQLYEQDIEATKQELEAGEGMFKQIGKLIRLEVLALDYYHHSYCTPYEWNLDDSIEDEWLKELAGLNKLRYLYMPRPCWEEEQLSTFIDSSWPRLERVSSGVPDDCIFKWLKARRPWLRIVLYEQTTL